LTIKQLVDPAGHNRLRKSKIDIGVYDQNYKRHLIKDFVLSDTTPSNALSVDQLKQVQFDGPVKAIILNEGDHVYSKVRFDKSTLNSLKQDGIMVKSSLTRSLIWRSMW